MGGSDAGNAQLRGRLCRDVATRLVDLPPGRRAQRRMGLEPEPAEPPPQETSVAACELPRPPVRRLGRYRWLHLRQSALDLPSAVPADLRPAAQVRAEHAM